MLVHFLARTELCLVGNSIQYTPYTVKRTFNRIPRKLNVFQRGFYVLIIQMPCQKFRTHVLYLAVHIFRHQIWSDRSRIQISTWRSILTDFWVSTFQNKILNSKHSVTYEVLIKVNVAVTICWDVMPLITLKMKASGFFKT